MADIDTLRPEVAAAVRTMRGESGGNCDDAYDVIESELLRLTDSRNQWQQKYDLALREWAEDFKSQSGPIIQRAERAEAELAALKARIAAAPVGTCDCDAHPWLTVDDADLPDEYEGQRVALVKVED